MNARAGGGRYPRCRPFPETMNGWNPLTEAEVLRQFNDSETQAYNAAKGDDNGAALGDIITKVIDEIRLAYANGARAVDVDNATTLPDGEKNRAIALVRWRFLIALPTGEGLAKFRKEDAEAAREYFGKVAKREIKFSNAAQARRGRCIRTDSFNGIAST